MVDFIKKYRSRIDEYIRETTSWKNEEGIALLVKASIAHQAGFDCFYNKITVPYFKKVMKHFDITLEDLLTAFKKNYRVRTSGQWSRGRLTNTLIRFIYYNEIHGKYPFGLWPSEIAKLILATHSETIVSRDYVKLRNTVSAAFKKTTGGYRGPRIDNWYFWTLRILGADYAVESRRGGSKAQKVHLKGSAHFIVKYNDECALRILLEGVEANAPRIKAYKKLYAVYPKPGALTNLGDSVGMLKSMKNPYGFERKKTTMIINESGEIAFELIFGYEATSREFRKRWNEFCKLEYKGEPIREELYKKAAPKGQVDVSFKIEELKEAIVSGPDDPILGKMLKQGIKYAEVWQKKATAKELKDMYQLALEKGPRRNARALGFEYKTARKYCTARFACFCVAYLPKFKRMAAAVIMGTAKVEKEDFRMHSQTVALMFRKFVFERWLKKSKLTKQRAVVE